MAFDIGESREALAAPLSESEAEEERRLSDQRTNKQVYRLLESSGHRKARLAAARRQVARRRKAESTEEREKRLARDRTRQALARKRELKDCWDGDADAMDKRERRLKVERERRALLRSREKAPPPRNERPCQKHTPEDTEEIHQEIAKIECDDKDSELIK